MGGWSVSSAVLEGFMAPVVCQVGVSTYDDGLVPLSGLGVLVRFDVSEDAVADLMSRRVSICGTDLR